MCNVKILSEDEFLRLPYVLNRRDKFKNIIIQSIKNNHVSFTNSVIIKGRPGTGKTTLVTEFLDELESAGDISGYVRNSGHITQTSLFSILKESSDNPNKNSTTVHVFDDVDCLHDNGCLEILKSALDTRSKAKTNRRVSYHTKGVCNSFKYEGFTIIITNESLEDPGVHLQALLDRVHVMEVELEPEDFKIYSLYISEEFINDSDLDDEVKTKVAEFIDSTIRAWFDNDCFAKCNINFSIRLVMKFIDLMSMFGDEWTHYSSDYKRLNKYLKLVQNN